MSIKLLYTVFNLYLLSNLAHYMGAVCTAATPPKTRSTERESPPFFGIIFYRNKFVLLHLDHISEVIQV